MKIKVLVFEPGKDGEVREIEDSLQAMQGLVGGYIEQVFIPGLTTPGTERPRLVAICDEEGALKNSLPNRWGLVGTFFVVKQDGSDYTSLSQRDVAEIQSLRSS